jgi:serine/threonine protein kinase
MTSYQGPMVDVWAMGVVLYIMLTGFIPFPSPARIQAIRYGWPPEVNPSVPCQNLLRSIFQPASQRITVARITTDEWTTMGLPPISQLEPACRSAAPCDLQEDILEEMLEHYGWDRDAVEAALSAHHVSSQVATTYHLLEYRKLQATAPKNPIWKGHVIHKKKQGNACVMQ